MRKVSLDDLPLQGVTHNPDVKKRVMLGNLEVPGLTNFSQAVFGGGQTAAGHAHDDMYEVFFVRRGRGVIRVDGTEHPLSPGDCVLVEPGEHHEIGNRSSGELVLLYFGIRRDEEEVQS